MMRALMLAVVALGVTFSRAALACEDGPECQDPSPTKQAAGESTPPAPSPIADARYAQERAPETVDRGASAGSPEAER